MCKQYVYLNLCIEHDCESIVGKKGRNAYCRAARHGARRLGFCDGGLAYVVVSRHRGTVVCDECKQLRFLRQLSASVSAATTGKGKGGEEGVLTEGEEVLRSDDGCGSLSSWGTIRGYDEENAGSLRFFANKKEKDERLASAYDFDLAMEQEIAALNTEDTRAASPEEEEAYLAVTGGPDDSTIEYENEVSESIRHKGVVSSQRKYYGFAAVGVEERIPPRPQPQSCLQYVDQEEAHWEKKQQIGDDPYDSDTTATVVVMTPSGSESGFEVEVGVKHDLHSEIRKEMSSGPETASDTVMEADSPSSEEEPVFNDKFNFRLRPEALNRACVDRAKGRDIMITLTNSRRGLVPQDPLIINDWPADSGDGNRKEGAVKKENESHGYEKDEDNERGSKRAPLSFWDVVLQEGAKRRRIT